MKSKRKAAASDVDFGEDQAAELQAAFDFYGGSSGALKKDDIRAIMTKLNLPASNDILQKMMADGDLAGTGSIDFAGFMAMWARKLKKLDNEATVLEAFRAFDSKGSGNANYDELYKDLTTMGDKLTQAEWDEAAAVADKDGVFNYHDLMKEMFGARSAPPAQAQ